MGIGQFRREVQRWLNGSLLSAQQDAESASRMPTDVDPVGIIDARVVDAVEWRLHAKIVESKIGEIMTGSALMLRCTFRASD